MEPHPSRPGLVVDVAEPCPAWRDAIPDIDNICCETACAAWRAGGGAEGAELSLVLSDDAAMRTLNREWRGKDRPTNVLSFATGEATLPGDIVLAFETVAREATEQGKPLPDHLRHLVVHGVLHLLGHDHEAQEEAERMEALETSILAGLGIADPYAETADV